MNANQWLDPNGLRKQRAATRLRLCWLAMLMLVLCSAGCVQVDDALTLRADGSGEIKLKVVDKSGSAAMMLQNQRRGMMMMGNNQQPARYPPMNEAEMRALFPGESFKIAMSPKKDNTVEATVTFASIAELLKSPYAELHSLSMEKKDGKLLVHAMSGLQEMASVSEDKDSRALKMIGLNDDKRAEMEAEFSYRFALTLPSAATAEGAKVEGATAVWTVTPAKEGDSVAARLRKPLSASCADKDLKWTPISIPRLSYGSFDEVKEGVSSQKAETIDAAAVIKAAKWIPVQIVTTRTFDLTGESYGENECRFQGIIEIDKKFAPIQWGQAKVVNATDIAGNLLAPENNNRHTYYGGYNMMLDKTNAKESVVRHMVNFTMKPPSYVSPAISDFKGTIPLQYPGIPQVIKIPNAVTVRTPNETITSMMDENGVSHPVLLENGIKIRYAQGQSQGHMIYANLMLEGESGKISFSKIIAYDADGKPWPTQMANRNSGSNINITLFILGNPKGPLSLACLLEAGGTTVDLPIEVKSIPVTANTGESTDKADETAEKAAPAIK